MRVYRGKAKFKPVIISLDSEEEVNFMNISLNAIPSPFPKKDIPKKLITSEYVKNITAFIDSVMDRLDEVEEEEEDQDPEDEYKN